MPVISKATTKGTIVIWSAFSHIPPIGSAKAISCGVQAEAGGGAGDAGAEPEDQGEQDAGRLGGFQKNRPSWFMALSGPLLMAVPRTAREKSGFGFA